MDRLRNRVFVTGMGIVSALGIGIEKNLQSLINGKPGIGKIRHLKTKLDAELSAGEVNYPNEKLIQLSGIKNPEGISRAALLGIIAAKEAIANSHLNPSNNKTAIISGTTAESMTNIERYLNDFLANDSKNEFIESQDWGFSTEIIAEELGLEGYQSTINTACSSAANAIMTGARMLENNILDSVIVGGTDALSKVMLNGFHALMILDTEISKPFDKDRAGMNLGEGAAFLVLESEKTVDKKKVLCELRGWGNSNDAYHLTALSPDGKGAATTMSIALEKAGLKPEEINYINTHGTGTANNDLSEALGIKQVFGSQTPLFSSTKPFTGHTLGSAGALEAVFSILSIQENIVFPNLNFKERMSEVDIEPTTIPEKRAAVHHVLSNSFGFGGNNTSLIFSSRS